MIAMYIRQMLAQRHYIRRSIFALPPLSLPRISGLMYTLPAFSQTPTMRHGGEGGTCCYWCRAFTR
ncbi:hypothetical protein KCP75_24285 [Salmonella enterica subsp. enterica]|nr:hypothetical protein KCP75_24285 [Salmonella enterica subsp. enterica]